MTGKQITGWTLLCTVVLIIIGVWQCFRESGNETINSPDINVEGQKNTVKSVAGQGDLVEGQKNTKNSNISGEGQVNIIDSDLTNVQIIVINKDQNPPNSLAEIISKVVSTDKPASIGKPAPINVALNKPVVYLKYPLIDESQYYERYSINRGNYPSNLTDGNLKTVAYPAARAFQYIVDLGEVFNIKRINLVWGDTYGFSGEHIYVTRWALYYQDEISDDKEITPDDWKLVESGGVPGVETYSINLEKSISVKRFRIVALSLDKKSLGTGKWIGNWIGMNEFEAYTE